MKPCSKNRKLIAWLTLDALDAREAAKLHDHFIRCEECRRYWEATSNLAERVASSLPEPQLEASEIFHDKVAARLHAVDHSSVLENLKSWFHELHLNWRVALPTVAALAFVIVASLAPHKAPTSNPTAPLVAEFVPTSNSERELAPTLANYQLVADQSLDKLDELLTSQGNKRLPPVPALSISSLERAHLFY